MLYTVAQLESWMYTTVLMHLWSQEIWNEQLTTDPSIEYKVTDLQL